MKDDEEDIHGFLTTRDALLARGYSLLDKSKTHAAFATPESTADVTQFVELKLVRSEGAIAVYYGVTNKRLEYLAIDACNIYWHQLGHPDRVRRGTTEYKRARFCKLQAFDERRMPWLESALTQSPEACASSILGYMERRFLPQLRALKTRQDHYALLSSDPDFFPWGRTGGALRFLQAAILGTELGVPRDVLEATLTTHDRDVAMSFSKHESIRDFMRFALIAADKFRRH